MIPKSSELLVQAVAEVSRATPDPQPEKPENSQAWIEFARRTICKAIPEQYQGARIRQFSPSPSIDYSREGVLLKGKTGIGKTHLATAIAIDMLRPDHFRTIYRNHDLYEGALGWVSTPLLMARIRSTFKKNASESEMQIIEEVSRYRCLVLDDLGAEKVTDYSASTLYSILANRRNHRRFTIVTTNQTLEEINTWEPRMASRLAEYARVELPNVDRRLAK